VTHLVLAIVNTRVQQQVLDCHVHSIGVDVLAPDHRTWPLALSLSIGVDLPRGGVDDLLPDGQSFCSPPDCLPYGSGPLCPHSGAGLHISK